MTRPRERSTRKAGIEPRSPALEADALTAKANEAMPPWEGPTRKRRAKTDMTPKSTQTATSPCTRGLSVRRVMPPCLQTSSACEGERETRRQGTLFFNLPRALPHHVRPSVKLRPAISTDRFIESFAIKRHFINFTLGRAVFGPRFHKFDVSPHFRAAVGA